MTKVNCSSCGFNLEGENTKIRFELRKHVDTTHGSILDE